MYDDKIPHMISSYIMLYDLMQIKNSQHVIIQAVFKYLFIGQVVANFDKIILTRKYWIFILHENFAIAVALNLQSMIRPIEYCISVASFF